MQYRQTFTATNEKSATKTNNMNQILAFTIFVIPSRSHKWIYWTT